METLSTYVPLPLPSSQAGPVQDGTTIGPSQTLGGESAAEN